MFAISFEIEAKGVNLLNVTSECISSEIIVILFCIQIRAKSSSSFLLQTLPTGL